MTTVCNDVVLIFGRDGNILAQLPKIISVRTWNGKGTGTGGFDISAEDTNATADILKLNNRIVVMSDVVPYWAGIVWPLPRISSGVIRVECAGAEAILAQRETGTGKVTLTGTPGSIITQLLAIANASEATGITVGTIVNTGDSVSREFTRVDICQAISRICKEFSLIWYITPTISGSSLTMTLNVQAQQGTAFTTKMEDLHNMFIRSLTSEGSMANKITYIGRGESGNSPPEYTATDTASISMYGLIEDSVSAMDTNISTLAPLAESVLAQRAYPRIKIEAIIVKSPFPRIGDLVEVVVKSQGLYNGYYDMTIDEVSYDALENVEAVIMREAL